MAMAMEVGAEFFDGPPLEKLSPVGGSVHTKWESVGATLPGFTVEILPHIDSTNSELMRRAKTGQTEPILLVAEHQTGGRGRLGRTWQDDGVGATSLMFSMGLVLNPADWSGLSLAVGLCVAQSLHPDLRIKWPNDVYLDGRKMAGILIETAAIPQTAQPAMAPNGIAARFVVIGVGINIAPRGASGLSTPPAWLQELLPGLDAGEALQMLLPLLMTTVRQFEAQGFAPYQLRFNALDALAACEVGLSDGTQGMAQGVDASGALMVHTSAGLVKVTSSEVSVRPVQPDVAPKLCRPRPESERC